MDFAVFGLLILIAISAVIYHVIERHIGTISNPLYITANAIVIAAVIMLVVNLINKTSINEILRAFNISTICVAVGWVLYNICLALAYRNGAKTSTIFNITTALSSILLVLIGLILLAENFSWINGAGVFFAMLGVYFLSNQEVKDEK